MHSCTPSYSFSTVNQQRTFHHRWHTSNGQIYECQACCSTCAVNETFAAHWQFDERHTKSTEQLAFLQRIENEKIKKFMLCNKNVAQTLEKPEMKRDVTERHQFLLNAGMNAIPALLQLMWYDTDEIALQLGLHVCVKESALMLKKKERNATDTALEAKKSKSWKKATVISEAYEAVLEATDMQAAYDVCLSNELIETFEAEKSLLFKSSFLNIASYYDIEESIDVLLIMLLECIERYLVASNAIKSIETSEYVVQRIEINLKRSRNAATQQKLPLQYSVKRACYNSALPQTTAGLKFTATKLNANFYAFKTCNYSGELFVVPYSVSPTALTNAAASGGTPNYIITSNSNEKTQNFLLIKNLRKFLRHEIGDCVLSCKYCNAKFMQQTKLVLHRRLQCGRDFKVIKMAADFVELYERCLPLQCAEYNWPLYGIVE